MEMEQEKAVDVDFYLLVEARFHSSYLVTSWLKAFQEYAGFKGVLLREEPVEEQTRTVRERLHREYRGQTTLTGATQGLLEEFYPELSETEQTLIRLAGIPEHSISAYPATTFLGTDLNNGYAKRWLAGALMPPRPLFLFIYIDQILEPWWLESTGSRIINAHPAVLPYARGMFAIENIAASQEIAMFTRSAGASVHYIDAGVDTGPLIKTERFVDPFAFGSIWEQKAHACLLAFDLLVSVAQSLLSQPLSVPAGIPADPLQRGPNFKSEDFTPFVRQQAEHGYLQMKDRVLQKR